MKSLATWFIVLCLVMLNPPVLTWVNAYAVANPFVGSLPVLYAWFYGWFLILSLGLIAIAATAPEWDGAALERRLAKYIKQ